jgi:hypothetical protein
LKIFRKNGTYGRLALKKYGETRQTVPRRMSGTATVAYRNSERTRKTAPRAVLFSKSSAEYKPYAGWHEASLFSTTLLEMG